MHLKRSILALVTATAVSIVLAVVMTALDWRKNPNGIFHTSEGTNWSIVSDTFSSWIWPGLFLLAPLFLIVILIRIVKDSPSSDKKDHPE